MAVSTYGASTETSGVVRLLKDLDTDLGQARDPGRGHRRLGPDPRLPVDTLPPRRPASLEACVLLIKPEKLKTDLKVRYKGFDIPSAFVVGLRARLRRALPQPAVRGHAKARGVRDRAGRASEDTNDEGGRVDIATALDRLPKVELHCHVEGTMRPPTVVELARRTVSRCPPPTPPSCTATLASTPSSRSSGWCSRPSPAGRTGPGWPTRASWTAPPTAWCTGRRSSPRPGTWRPGRTWRSRRRAGRGHGGGRAETGARARADRRHRPCLRRRRRPGDGRAPGRAAPAWQRRAPSG